MRNNKNKARLLCGAAFFAASLSVAGAGHAQSTPAPAEASDQTVQDEAGSTELQEIVVTGTLLRGVAPTGTNVVGVTSEDIVSTGVTSSADLLARVPQVTNAFGGVPQGSSTIAEPITRPNIRSLGASGGSTTLILLNGNRMVGAGILQTSPDPSAIPPQVLERVEVIPDGGSSIYGSDAIGGVINFITRKRYDGVELTAKYGMGDEYSTTDFSAMAGKDWGSGSALIAYAYAQHDAIAGADRDWFTQNNLDNGGSDFRSQSCTPGNITAGGVSYRMDTRTAGVNLCDENKAIDFYPREERHSVYGALSQALTDKLSFDVTGYYSERDTVRRGQSPTDGTGIRGSGTITAANPYFRPIGAETSQTVAFNYSAVAGDALENPSNFTSAGLTPTLTYRFDGGWQLRATANYGRSTNTVHTRQINTTAQAAALAGTTTATALNPYDVAATNAAVLDSILDYELYGDATQEIRSVRTVADGSIFSTAAGEARLALGAEYYEETLDQMQGEGTIGNPIGASSSSDRDVTSLFGEIFVPLTGLDSGAGALDVNASMRMDVYSDVGDTINPKVGFNWRPVAELRVRGNWGTSFHAPSLSDLGASVDTRAQVLAVSPFRAAGSPFTDLFRPTILLAGGNPDLKPEEATTWSFGADWTPSGALDGLKVNVTYFNVDFTDAIGLAPFFNGASYFANPSYASFYTLNPTQAQAEAATAGMRVENAPSITSLYTGGGATPYALIDARRNNLGSLKVDGLDFNVSYDWTLPLGTVTTGLAGTYTLDRESQAVANAPVVDELDNSTSRYSLVGTLGWRNGPVSLETTVNHRAGYDVVGTVGQTSVDAYTLVSLFARYELPASRWTEGAALTLNIDNLFDEDPPYFNSAQGYANGATLGRVVSVGVRKTF
jgi:iron complex outermembrane receptor protein